MTRYFKNKKMLRKRELIKYFIILIIVYYTLKFSIFILHSTKLFKYVFKQNKLVTISNALTDNLINEPVNLLKINNIHNIKTLNNPHYYIKDKIVINSNNPKIYIYNSHPLEKYLDNNKSIYDMDYVFKESFKKYNIDTYIEDGDINNFLLLNNLEYGYSYIASRSFIEDNIKNNDYDLIIDLHRDATNHDDTYIDINGLPCVKILFVVGGLNPNYESNYSLASELSNLINSKYPYLSRGVIVKSGANVNGLYNQDLSPRMVLLELGGNNNTEQEVINTINLLSELIGEYLNGNKSI